MVMIKAYGKLSWISNINLFRLPAYEPNIPHMRRGVSFACTKITSKALGALKTDCKERKKNFCLGVTGILPF